MNSQDYQITITTSATPQEAFNTINRVSDWWINGTTGSTGNLNDNFQVNFSSDSFVAFRVIASAPGKSAKWLVTDCNIPGLKDVKEWKDTIVEWELTPKDGSTEVTMTHTGLVPGIECYEMCVKGWNFYTGESLKNLLETGKGNPDTPREQRQ